MISFFLAELAADDGKWAAAGELDKVVIRCGEDTKNAGIKFAHYAEDHMELACDDETGGHMRYLRQSWRRVKHKLRIRTFAWVAARRHSPRRNARELASFVGPIVRSKRGRSTRKCARRDLRL
jgi:hypothetical protein